MEKSRRKSNPTKIERKSSNMAADGKDVPLGRRESSKTFFKNEIEWEKRRLQRMKHLKCCPRVPNRVLAALTVGEASSFDQKSLVGPDSYGMDTRYSLEYSQGKLGETEGEESETVSEYHAHQNGSFVIHSVGSAAGDKYEHTCGDGSPQHEPVKFTSSENPVDHVRGLEDRNEPFDTEAFLCSAFGDIRPRKPSNTPIICDGQTMLTTPALQSDNEEEARHSQLPKRARDGSMASSAIESFQFSASEKGPYFQSQLNRSVSTEATMMISAIKSEAYETEESSSNRKVAVKEENDNEPTACDHGNRKVNEMAIAKSVKVEACEDNTVKVKVPRDGWHGNPSSRGPPDSEDCDITTQASDMQRKSPSKVEGPVINLVHSLDTSFPLPSIIKQAKEKSLALNTTSPMRSGFIDLNSTKSVAQEHVLKSIHGIQTTPVSTVQSSGSFIVLDSRARLSKPDCPGAEEYSRRLSVSSNSPFLSSNELVLSSHSADRKDLSLALESRNRISPHERLSVGESQFPMSASDKDSSVGRGESSLSSVSPRSTESGSDNRSPRSMPNRTMSPFDCYTHPSTTSSRISPAATANRSNVTKKADCNGKPDMNQPDQHRRFDIAELPRVMSYRGFDPSFDRQSEAASSRALSFQLRNYSSAKRVHPDFQTLSNLEFREMSIPHPVQESPGAAKILRQENVPQIETKDTPLANNRATKAKLTSLVTPHQNQSLTYRRHADRPLQLGRNFLVPRVIGEDNVNNLFDPLEISPNKLSQWTSRDVCHFLEQTDCREYANVFLQQEIDGKTLLVLTEEQISRLLKIKIGPSIKLYTHIANLRNILSQI